MREYLKNKHKKVILEEYIIDQFKDYQSEDGAVLVNVDIDTLIEGESTAISLVYKSTEIEEYPFDDTPDKVITKYYTQTMRIYVTSDNKMYSELPTNQPRQLSVSLNKKKRYQGIWADQLNAILMMFCRNVNIDNVLSGTEVTMPRLS